MITLVAILCGLSIGSLAQTSPSTTSTSTTQTSTTDIFLPIVNSQALVASQVKQDKDIQTLVVRCPDGTDSGICGFPTPVTITAGPSTLALTTTVQNALTVELKCHVDASKKAECTEVYTGPASYMTSTASGDEGSKTTSWTSSVTLDPGKVTFLPVTITAGIKSTSKSDAAPPPRAFGGILAAGLIANLAAHL